MKMPTRKMHLPVFATFAASAAACTSQGELEQEPDRGDGAEAAALEIVGDSAIALDPGQSAELEVRYADPEGVPLNGEVDFYFDTDDDGVATLGEHAVAVDDQGIASTTVDANGGGEERFEVAASAPEADPVAWEVAVAAPEPLDPSGSYAITSDLDFASGAPGQAGETLNLIMDFTDHPADPTLWIAERLADEIPLVDFSVPESMARTINDIVMDVTNLGPIFDRLGNVGDAAEDFGLRSRLEITGEDGDFEATHTVEGVVFQIGGQLHEYSFTELGLQPGVAQGVEVTLDEDAEYFGVSEHAIDVPYGAVLRILMEEAVLGGADLEELIVGGGACDAIGSEIASRLSLSVGSSVIASACQTVVSRGAGGIMDQIEALDSADGVLTLRGDAVPVDVAGDRRVDQIAEGAWEGALEISGSETAILPEANPFDAERTGS